MKPAQNSSFLFWTNFIMDDDETYNSIHNTRVRFYKKNDVLTSKLLRNSTHCQTQINTDMKGWGLIYFS